MYLATAFRTLHSTDSSHADDPLVLSTSMLILVLAFGEKCFPEGNSKVHLQLALWRTSRVHSTVEFHPNSPKSNTKESHTLRFARKKP